MSNSFLGAITDALTAGSAASSPATEAPVAAPPAITEPLVVPDQLTGQQPVAPEVVPVEIVDDYQFDPNADPLAVAPVNSGLPASAREAFPVEDGELAKFKEQALAAGTVNPTKWERLHGALKFTRELDLPQEEGGLGYRPDPRQVVSAFKASEQFSAIKDDFVTGRPEAAVAFSDFWFGRDRVTGGPNAGAMEMAAALPSALAQVNPMAYQAMIQPIANGQIEALERMKSSRPESEHADFDFALQTLRWAHKALGITPDGPIVQPVAQPLLVQQNQPVRQQQPAHGQQGIDAITQSFHASLNQTIEAEVAGRLKAITDPEILSAMKMSLKGKLIEALRANTAVTNLVMSTPSKIAKGDQAAARTAIHNARLAYGPTLQEYGGKLIQGLGGRAAAAATAGQILQNSQHMNGGSGNGVAPSPTPAPVQHAPGTSSKDRMQAELIAKMTAPRLN